MTLNNPQKNSILIWLAIAITILILCSSCNKHISQKEKINDFKITAEIGKNCYLNCALKLYKTKKVINLKSLDSLYNIEIDKSAKRIYNEN